MWQNERGSCGLDCGGCHKTALCLPYFVLIHKSLEGKQRGRSVYLSPIWHTACCVVRSNVSKLDYLCTISRYTMYDRTLAIHTTSSLTTLPSERLRTAFIIDVWRWTCRSGNTFCLICGLCLPETVDCLHGMKGFMCQHRTFPLRHCLAAQPVITRWKHRSLHASSALPQWMFSPSPKGPWGMEASSTTSSSKSRHIVSMWSEYRKAEMKKSLVLLMTSYELALDTVEVSMAWNFGSISDSQLAMTVGKNHSSSRYRTSKFATKMHKDLLWGAKLICWYVGSLSHTLPTVVTPEPCAKLGGMKPTTSWTNSMMARHGSGW